MKHRFDETPIVKGDPLVPLVDPETICPPPSSYEQPEKRLLAHMLELALDEARGRVIGRSRYDGREKIQRTTQAWFADTQARGEHFTIATVCEHLGINYGVIVRALALPLRARHHIARTPKALQIGSLYRRDRCSV